MKTPNTSQPSLTEQDSDADRVDSSSARQAASIETVEDELTDTEPIGRTVGRLTHVVIGKLLADGPRSPNARAIIEAVTALDLDAVKSVHPYAVIQQLVVTAAIYFRLFLPSEDWSLESREYAVAGVRFDLVFRSKAGQVFVDQIKTGRIERPLPQEQLARQVRREVLAGQNEWGSQFAGVRAVILGSPRASRFFDSCGDVHQVEWEGVS